jgi:hypothetical protein
MKKIISAISIIAVTALCMTACGNEEYIVLENNEDAYHIVETEPATTLRKVKNIITTTADKQEKSTEVSETDIETTVVTNTANTTPAEEVTESAVENLEDTTQSAETPDNNDTQDTDINPEEQCYLEGIVYNIRGKGILLREKDMQLISIGFKDDSTVDALNVGDEVLITYNGEIMESYPAQAHNAYSAEVTKKAVFEGKVNHFICENETINTSFTVILPENWTVKEIEYPDEGEFTDWGFRIIPEGETTGLDISWHSAFSIRESYDVTPVTVNGNNAERYGANGKWRFYAYENSYIAANNFYGTSLYDEYADEFEFILETLMFNQHEFIVE